MIANSVLEGLPGVGAVVVGDEDGHVRGPGTSGRADVVALATSVIVRELGHTGGSFRLGRCEVITIKGQSAAQVVGHQHGTIAFVELEASRPTGDVERRLRKPDWASGGVDTVEVAPVHDAAPEHAAGVAGTETSGLPVAGTPADGPLLKAAGIHSRGVVFAGDLHIFGLADVLELLRANRRTGVLVCSSAAGTGTVQLRNGQVVGAASPASPSISGSIAEMRDGLLAATTGAIRELVTWVDGRFDFHPSSPDEPQVPGLNLELDSRSLLLDIFATDA